jgi:hypothetical protein
MSDFQLTADDLVGVLIHNSNQLTAVLSNNGMRTNFDAVLEHLARMAEIARRCGAAQAQQLDQVPAAHANGDAHAN